ncbi:hypothetical protein MB901379_03882 [Mycobacterium basiliense]|uniref:Uncharacterized protein n=1 Tax=Mycobacterium basiliense TaxID=2094119 RepID=A0A3S4BGP3_9MYCO|nr:hypothetical protein MB901379_03882 [Mycobacterium basiliense]
MKMTVRRRRRKTPLDTTPTTIDVTPGIAVFFDGAQRSGRLHAVPQHLARKWQRQRWVSIVCSEPASAGVASNAINNRSTVAQAAATTAPSLRESDELRDTSTDPGAGPPPPPPGKGGTPRGSVKNGLYGSQKFSAAVADSADKVSNPLSDNVTHVDDGGSDGVSEPSFAHDLPVGPLTGSGPARTGSRVCPNCLSPVSGRRKWCSEACRVQAYRGRMADETPARLRGEPALYVDGVTDASAT